MAAIYLIRHGQASFGQENYDQLSDLGIKQASHLGNALKSRGIRFDAVSLGSMWRHEQTATHCLKKIQDQVGSLEGNKNPGWNEYDHQEILRVYRPEFATAEKMTDFIRRQTDPKSFFETEFNAAIDRWIGGQYDDEYQETWTQFSDRVHRAFNNAITVNPKAKSIAVFTSGGPISLVTQALLGVPPEQIMRMNWTLMNCGVSKVVTTGNRRFLATLNEHTHFEGESNKHLITYT